MMIQFGSKDHQILFFPSYMHVCIEALCYDMKNEGSQPIELNSESARTIPFEQLMRSALSTHPGMSDEGIVDLSEALEGESPEVLAARINSEALFSWTALFASAS